MKLFYGITHNDQIRQIARAVCDVLGHGKTNQAITMLLRTCAQETGMGTIRDANFRKHGVGLYQIDPIGFTDVQMRTRKDDRIAVSRHFGATMSDVTHQELAFSPLLSTVYARLFYKLRPEAFPETLEGQADYWKRVYNSTAGKGTPQQFIESARRYNV